RKSSSRLTRTLRPYGLQIGIVVVAILIWGVFALSSPRTWGAPEIYGALMSTTPFFAIMAIPLTLVVITGEMDLSFPSIMAFGMTAFSLVLKGTGSVELAFAACLLAGLLAGLLNGFIVVKIGIPSLVTTIGTQFFWRGVVLVITGGNGTSLGPMRDGFLYNALVARVNGIPMQMVWTILIAMAVWFFLNRHKFGAHLYLTGDNVDSARLMGVNVNRIKMVSFAVVGLAAAFAAIVVSAELLYFWPTIGEGYMLNTLASVFLGGTSVFGGTGTVFGTLVASFIIGSINAGIVAAGMTGFWTQLIYGLIIVGSVSLQTILGKKLGK
ncbi:MAG TPA: ABC transporter permease, partial [Anaerolineae bacterium]